MAQHHAGAVVTVTSQVPNWFVEQFRLGDRPCQADKHGVESGLVRVSPGKVRISNEIERVGRSMPVDSKTLPWVRCIHHYLGNVSTYFQRSQRMSCFMVGRDINMRLTSLHSGPLLDLGTDLLFTMSSVVFTGVTVKASPTVQKIATV